MDDPFLTVMDCIRKRTFMYIPARRATLLEAFIRGFDWAAYHSKIDMEIWRGFRESIHYLPGVKPGPFMADELIQITGSDEAAFEEFFRLLDAYVRDNPTNAGAPE